MTGVAGTEGTRQSLVTDIDLKAIGLSADINEKRIAETIAAGAALRFAQDSKS